MHPTFRRLKKLHKQAYAAFGQGRSRPSRRILRQTRQTLPSDSGYRHMQGLTAKNRLDWHTALAANLRAIECAEAFDEAAHWNAAFPASAVKTTPRPHRRTAASGGCGTAIEARKAV